MVTSRSVAERPKLDSNLVTIATRLGYETASLRGLQHATGHRAALKVDTIGFLASAGKRNRKLLFYFRMSGVWFPSAKH